MHPGKFIPRFGPRGGNSQSIYKPSENRFEIAKDPAVRERYKLVKETCNEIEEEFPDVKLGFRLFGSLTKGRAVSGLLDEDKKPDIDIRIYFDINDLKNKLPKSKYYKECLEMVGKMHFWSVISVGDYFLTRRQYIWKSYIDIVKKEFHDKLEAKLSKSEHNKGCVSVHVLFSLMGGESKITKNFFEFTLSVLDQIFIHLPISLFNGRPIEDDMLNNLAHEYAYLFVGLDMGGRVEPYLKRFLKKLYYMYFIRLNTKQKDNFVKMLRMWVVDIERSSRFEGDETDLEKAKEISNEGGEVETFEEFVYKVAGLSEKGLSQYPGTYQQLRKRFKF